MNSPERVFPLYLDLVVNYTPSLTAFWTGYQTSNTGKTSGYLRITSNTTASWAKFDISGIPSGSTINSIAYYGYHYSGTGNSTPKNCAIRQMINDPVLASASTLYSESYNGIVYNSSFQFATTSFAWQTANLNSTAVSYMASVLSQGWFAIGMGYVSGGTSFAYHDGVNQGSGASNMVYLRVDFRQVCIYWKCN